MTAMRAAGWVVLLLLNQFCFAVIFVGVRFGLAHGYTMEDWLSIFVPHWREEGELSAWFMFLPLVVIPLVTSALVLRKRLKRPRRA
jgi:hypothetical protein